MKFAFEAQLWNQVVERKLMLTKVFRQKDQGSCPSFIQHDPGRFIDFVHIFSQISLTC